jgi:hypothetical protein
VAVAPNLGGGRAPRFRIARQPTVDIARLASAATHNGANPPQWRFSHAGGTTLNMLSYSRFHAQLMDNLYYP